MMKKIIMVALVAMSFLAAQLSFADSDMQGNNCHFKERMHKMWAELKLDDAQKTKIEAIKQKMKDDMHASWQQMKALRAQMKTLVTSDKLDQSAVDKLASDKAALVSSLTKATITAKNQMYNVLNPTQKQQFQDMMQKWEEKRAAMKKECRAAQ